MARKPPKVPLSDFDDFADFCKDQKLRLLLDWGRDGWVLDVWRGDDLLARATSTLAPPKVYDVLALDAAVDLARSLG